VVREAWSVLRHSSGDDPRDCFDFAVCELFGLGDTDRSFNRAGHTYRRFAMVEHDRR